MSDEKQVTVDSIRDQLRADINFIGLFATMFDIEKRSDEQKAAIMSADNLARFGVNCGLIDKLEYAEWFSSLHKNEPPLGVTFLKYSKPVEDTPSP